MGSVLAQDYPNLEIVLVDDRSTDGTGRIIDSLADRDDRVRAVHVTDLPAGWLGKVHAMQQGLAQSTGEYFLLTDADVHFYHPGVLREAVSYCLADRIDHLAGLPELKTSGLLVGSMIAAFMPMLNMGMRLWAVNDPKSSACMGVGAFNMVRRAAFDRTEGFEWLKMEVADDAALGLLMKRSGARCRLVSARGMVGLEWYSTIGQMASGSDKGYATLGHCRLSRSLVLCVVLLGLELGPLAALVPWGAFSAGLALPGPRVLHLPALTWAALAVVGAFVVTTLRMTRWAGHPAGPAMLAPLGALLSIAIFARGCLHGFRRGGIVWRGTFYPADQLRRGARIHVFSLGGDPG